MVYAISFGYPAPRDKSQPRVPPLGGMGRKKLEDIVHWEKW